MKSNRIKLRPQKMLQNPFLKHINISKQTEDVWTGYIVDTPDHILIEWELIEIIISFIGYDFYYPEDDGCYFYFTTSDIKQYYYEITYQNFDKIYGKNGLFALLSFRKGVHYEKDEDMWEISLHPFIQGLRKEYRKDVMEYGIDFDKPWRRIL